MTRNICLLTLTCLVAACVPKAVVVEEAPVTHPERTTKPRPRAVGEPTPAVVPQVVQQSGMRLPDLTRKLPDRQDMTPTAAPAPESGSTVIATPPKE